MAPFVSKWRAQRDVGVRTHTRWPHRDTHTHTHRADHTGAQTHTHPKTWVRRVAASGKVLMSEKSVAAVKACPGRGRPPPTYRGPCRASYLARMFLHLPSSLRRSATSWRSAEFSFSRKDARMAIWFSLSRRASRERLAAMLFFRRRAQYLSSCRETHDASERGRPGLPPWPGPPSGHLSRQAERKPAKWGAGPAPAKDRPNSFSLFNPFLP